VTANIQDIIQSTYNTNVQVLKITNKLADRSWKLERLSPLTMWCVDQPINNHILYFNQTIFFDKRQIVSQVPWLQ
jgi:hypothetical protein